MHIRRLFFARLGALRRQRKQLLQQVPTGLQESEADFDPSSRLSEVTSTAQQLQHNSSAELRAHFHVSAFLRLSTEGRGVSTSSALSLLPPSSQAVRSIQGCRIALSSVVFEWFLPVLFFTACKNNALQLQHNSSAELRALLFMF